MKHRPEDDLFTAAKTAFELDVGKFLDDIGYDPQKDFAGSIEEGFRAIRERQANGGEGWVRK